MLMIQTHSQEETIELGEKLGASLPAGTILSLVAPLGAGKTWLSKGLARGIGGHEYDSVTSPAFTLVNEYASEHGPKVYHMDFYRLEELSPEDAEMFDEYFADEEAISIVEWGNKYLPSLGQEYLQVTVGFLGNEEFGRTFEIEVVGDPEPYTAVLAILGSE